MSALPHATFANGWIFSRPRYRSLRKAIGDYPAGRTVQAIFMRRVPDGLWRVELLVPDEEGRWLWVLERSPWKLTRIAAQRWLGRKTRAA